MNLKRAAIAISLSLAACVAYAAFPDKPVHLVVPAPPGGASDTVARLIAEKLQAGWGQPVVIENKPGASGAIGAEGMLQRPADGYTVLFHTGIIISTELTRLSVKYRTLRDFEPVTIVFGSPVFLVASNESGKGDLKAVLKSSGVTYGSHGAGTLTNYVGEQLKKAAQADMVHVPFAGDQQISQALMGGHIKTGFLSGMAARAAVDSGKVRALAVAASARSPALPSVPTLEELGYRGIDREAMGYAFVRAGTPKAIVDQLSHDIDRVARMPEMQRSIRDLGMTPKGGTSEEARREIQKDFNYWSKLIDEFGVLGN